MSDQAASSSEAAVERPTSAAEADPVRATPYAYYALALLVLANIFNYIDRQIVSIAAQGLKADLGLTDSELGFLLGTAFAVFYGVVGIAMGRIADSLSRTRLLTVGISLWSAMTTLSGFAGGFAGLASARLGVGIGEAVANPCAHSLLSQYFPPRNRSAVLATYNLGPHLGGALALAGGGLLLQHWGTICQALPGQACHLANWRAVFLIVGAPGLILAVLMALLREPARRLPPRRRSVAGLIGHEMSAAVPPFTFFNLFQIGGAGAVVGNLVFAAVLALAAMGLIALTGDWPQWAAVAVGVYSVVTWAGVLKRRDPPLYALTFGCTTFRLVAAGSALTNCVLGAAQAWSPTYMIRVLGASPGETGLKLGVTGAITAGLSVVLGGLVCDWWKRYDPRAPVWIVLIGLVTPIPAFLFMLHAKDVPAFVTAYAAFMFLAMTWAGGIGAMVQDLVLTRMRGTASASFSLVLILVGSSIGPYWAGKISTLTGSLTTGLYSILALAPIAAVLLVMGARRLGKDTLEARLARARAAGEDI